MDATEIEEIKKYEQQVIKEVKAELKTNDPVSRNINYRYFVSRSKGWRNGKQRIRRNWKEVRLVKFKSAPFTQWHRFPFDVYATEILGQWADGEILKERIEELSLD